MEMIWEKARDVGRLISQSDEYKALKRANERLSDDRETVTMLNRLQQLEASITRSLQSGQEPAQEEAQEYESVAGEVQGRPAYQGLESARINFDKLMVRIQEEIAKGIEAGEQSRIILPS